MSRRLLFVASILGLGGLASAQQEIDPSALRPALSPLIDLGAFNWNTKQWMSPEASARLRGTTTVVYNNTCSFATNFYFGAGTCSTMIDEGRIPSTTSPAAPVGATDTNDIVLVDFAYCSLAATGTVDIKVGFYNNMGGGCLEQLFGTPYTNPISGNAVAYFDFGTAAGNPLPGNSACYRFTLNLGNTGFCLQSDGNGVWDNGDIDVELFNWSFESDSPNTATPAASTGPCLAGNPALAGASACTYGVACGTDPTPWFAIPGCGNGLDTEDIWWVNIDNDIWGDTVNTGTTCPGAVPGAGCYWFGGTPGNPYASYYLVLASAGECAGSCTGTPTTYCTAGTSSVAAGSCVSNMSVSGVPSASNAGTCIVTANTMPGQKSSLGWISYGQLAAPFGANGHFICVGSPKQRTPTGSSGGTNGVCDGSFSFDINGFIAGQGGILLGNPVVTGTVVNCQVWFRDQGSGAGAGANVATSDGIQLTFCQ